MKKKIELEEHNFANEGDVNKNGSLLNPVQIHCCGDCGYYVEHKITRCPECMGTDIEEINE